MYFATNVSRQPNEREQGAERNSYSAYDARCFESKADLMIPSINMHGEEDVVTRDNPRRMAVHFRAPSAVPGFQDANPARCLGVDVYLDEVG